MSPKRFADSIAIKAGIESLRTSGRRQRAPKAGCIFKTKTCKPFKKQERK